VVYKLKKIRSGADSGSFDGEADDDDNVELEKSNVLLMGPTGSGKAFATIWSCHRSMSAFFSNVGSTKIL